MYDIQHTIYDVEQSTRYERRGTKERLSRNIPYFKDWVKRIITS
jgi:hypothetical protein